MGITQTKLQQEKQKNKELKTLEEKVKDLMYVGDLKW